MDIWDPLGADETSAARITKLRELEKKYDQYTVELEESKKIAKARKETVDMINFFEYCYKSISSVIPDVVVALGGLAGSIEKDRNDALKLTETSSLNAKADGSLYYKYWRLLY